VSRSSFGLFQGSWLEGGGVKGHGSCALKQSYNTVTPVWACHIFWERLKDDSKAGPTEVNSKLTK
jgi:hypothetical protein